MKSIKLKFIIIYLALVFVVMIVGGTFMLVRIKLTDTDKAYNTLKQYCQKVDDQVVQTSDLGSFQDELSRIDSYYDMASNGASLNILNPGGATIASTDYREGDKYARYTDPVIVSAAAGTEKFSVGRDISSGGPGNTWFNFAELVKDKGGQDYIIFARMNADTMYKNLTAMGVTMFFTFIIAMLLTAVFGVLFVQTLTAPLTALTKKAKDMALGHLDQEIPVNSMDEIGQLTESFNYMSKELNQSIEAITAEKNKIDITLNSMSDGVLTYDSAGALIHANPSAAELLASPDIESVSDLQNITFADMMKRLGLNIAHPLDAAEDMPKDSAVQLGHRFISASFTPYSNKHEKISGIVIVLQDVTKLKQLDDMRKEFVANVSHEIRTPLTTIKSYTETLIDGAIDNRLVAMDFLNTVNSEADRMTLLVHDLLELTHFDNNQLNLQLDRIDLVEILKQTVKQNSIIARHNSQRVILKEPGKRYIITGDAARINQVFTNIVNNALKYSNNNTDVEISCSEAGETYSVCIKDHGFGIPKEDLPHIFERFYRVDKARSRAMGGTGLGLAIAKEIVEAHGGRISASSVFGAGTAMTLEFRKTFKPPGKSAAG